MQTARWTVPSALKNSGIKTKDMTIIVAKYHTATNRLVDYNVTDIKAITGIRTYQANTFNTTVSDAEHISVMIWDTFTALTPLS